MRAARDHRCPVQHLLVRAHVLGQSTLEEQLLAIAVLQREEKCVVSLKRTCVRNTETLCEVQRPNSYLSPALVLLSSEL